MKKRSLVVAVVFLMTVFWVNSAFAGEMDSLVEKLVEKGVLKPSEAQEILKEVKEEAKKEREIVVQETKASLKDDGSLALNLSDWVQKTKLNGDFRLRYQNTDADGKPDRDRGRYRLRLGLVSQVTDKVEVGFGLATGEDDPRSTNQTFSDSFSTDDINMDYAYASYKPFSSLNLIGGKMKNPLWTPSDLLWDSDIRPEGVAIVFNKKMENAELFVNSGGWILDESSSRSDDPFMFVVQPGINLNLGDSAYFKNAIAWYGFTNVKGKALDYSAESNSTYTNSDGDEVLENDYDSFAISSELGFKTSSDALPFVALFG